MKRQEHALLRFCLSQSWNVFVECGHHALGRNLDRRASEVALEWSRVA